jgi:hypothetical protein
LVQENQMPTEADQSSKLPSREPGAIWKWQMLRERYRAGCLEALVGKIKYVGNNSFEVVRMLPEVTSEGNFLLPPPQIIEESKAVFRRAIKHKATSLLLWNAKLERRRSELKNACQHFVDKTYVVPRAAAGVRIEIPRPKATKKKGWKKLAHELHNAVDRLRALIVALDGIGKPRATALAAAIRGTTTALAQDYDDDFKILNPDRARVAKSSD